MLREPRVLEVARNVDVVLFDKTGTLTEGVMNVQAATISTAAAAVLGRTFADVAIPANILASAQAIESLNNHPVAQSITRYALANATEYSGGSGRNRCILHIHDAFGKSSCLIKKHYIYIACNL